MDLFINRIESWIWSYTNKKCIPFKRWRTWQRRHRFDESITRAHHILVGRFRRSRITVFLLRKVFLSAGLYSLFQCCIYDCQSIGTHRAGDYCDEKRLERRWQGQFMIKPLTKLKNFEVLRLTWYCFKSETWSGDPFCYGCAFIWYYLFKYLSNFKSSWSNVSVRSGQCNSKSKLNLKMEQKLKYV